MTEESGVDAASHGPPPIRSDTGRGKVERGRDGEGVSDQTKYRSELWGRDEFTCHRTRTTTF